jgi:DNA-binding protein HU-beta
VAVNRTELVEAVAAKAGLDRKRSEVAVEAVTESIVAEIKAGNRVSLFGFGTFDPTTRAARTARNPQTQATVRVPARKAVVFRPATAFKDALNSRGKAAASKKAAPAKKATAKKTAAKKSPAKATKSAKKR